MNKLYAIGGFVALLLICVLSYVSAYNYGNSSEQSIRAVVKNNENIYAQGAQKVSEVASVPGTYRDALLKVVTAELQGRYGSQGSTAAFIRESNPTLDVSVYVKVQQVVQGFRDDFTNAQTTLVDRCRSYQTNLGSLWTGFWLRIAGYPRMNVDDTCQIVTTDKAIQTFSTHRDTGLNLPH